jgi:hypothetical protein
MVKPIYKLGRLSLYEKFSDQQSDPQCILSAVKLVAESATFSVLGADVGKAISAQCVVLTS